MLAKTAPKQRLLTLPVANLNFVIPPGDPNHEGKAEAVFDQPVQLVYSQPHMHLRGKHMNIRLEYPTGESEMLGQRASLRLRLAADLLRRQNAQPAQRDEDHAGRALG